MKKFYKRLSLLISLIGFLGVNSQNVNVNIDLEQQRFLGEESNLDIVKLI